MKNFFTKVVQLQEDIIAVLACAATFQYFNDHASCDNVTTSQVFRIRCITFHETFAVFVNQVAAFTATAFRDQGTCTSDPGGMELPHFHILDSISGTKRHACAIARIHQCIGR